MGANRVTPEGLSHTGESIHKVVDFGTPCAGITREVKYSTG